MALSNSKLNCYSNCQRKYQHQYLLNTPPCKPQSPHLSFGTMAHEVLHKAGMLRDDASDGVVSNDDYYPVIPSEVAYPEFKEFFGISSWTNYFTDVIKQTASYEGKLIQDISNEDSSIEIFREVKFKLTAGEINDEFNTSLTDGINGVIDLLIVATDSNGKKRATIIDYKFSTKTKTQDNFDMDSQLPLYAFAVCVKYAVNINCINIGYIDIIKAEFCMPKILTNGKISISKDQNVSAEIYKACVEEIHGDDPKYNCKPGGHYYEAYCNFLLNKAAYLQLQYVDIEAYKGILADLFDCAEEICSKGSKGRYLAKYDSYSCAGCEFVTACKPWMQVNN